jgi:cytochrome c-type biogenesis protein CcmH/NrfG
MIRRLRTTCLGLAALLLAALPGCSSPSYGAGDDWSGAGGREPESAAMHSMARLYAAQGREADAEATLRALLAREPSFLPGWEELARLYVRRDLLDGALAALELGLREAPGDPVLLNDVGLCRLLQRDLPAAERAFAQAAAAAPDDARPRSNLALALALQGRDEEALAVWQQVLPAVQARTNLELVVAQRRP